MKTILVLGAGRSSSALISYLLVAAQQHQWRVQVADASLAAAQERVGDAPVGEALALTVHNEDDCRRYIGASDVVISLLPASLHPTVARYCLAARKHLLTASYVSDAMKSFHEEAQANGLLFLNECGLDPGIDHMSAMQVIDAIKVKGGQLTSFESFTGGLIAPHTDPQNPWRYKFTWNPRNVVMAGQGTARFLQDGAYKYIPYQQLFRRTTPISIAGYGEYEGYANRDSLKYIDTYGLHGIETMIRGTLRNQGYCEAWNVLVQLGCCDDTYPVDGVDAMTAAGFVSAFLPPGHGPLDVRVARYAGVDVNSEAIARLKWSGFFDEELLPLKHATPAQVTEYILNKRWQLNEDDQDFIMMWHRFVYRLEGRTHAIQAHLAVTGEDSTRTAMAKTVGLPLAIAATLLLKGAITDTGVVIPVRQPVYGPILKELAASGIRLVERHE